MLCRESESGAGRPGERTAEVGFVHPAGPSPGAGASPRGRGDAPARGERRRMDTLNLNRRNEAIRCGPSGPTGHAGLRNTRM